MCLSKTDLESFDVPEEHRLSNINLCGVPLMIYPSTFDKPMSITCSPVKLEEMPWESGKWKTSLSFSAYSAC